MPSWPARPAGPSAYRSKRSEGAGGEGADAGADTGGLVDERAEDVEHGGIDLRLRQGSGLLDEAGA
ncbi:hypothetical protein HOK021_21750 [Streptomyces hygroscopicus]|nr:hypothetical protein HOK021_21750 [Streptomyces hygroscopicus]